MFKKAANSLPQRRQLLLAALCAAAVYVIVPQLGGFHASWQLVRHPNFYFVAAAVILTFATYAAAAGTYCLLAARQLPFGRTLLVQLAAMFMNRLLPAGTGALGANYLYLRGQNHKTASAASIVALNNALGFAGHALVLLAVLLISPPQAVLPAGRTLPAGILLIIGASTIVLAIVAGIVWGWGRLRRGANEVRQQVGSYRQRPQALAGALMTSCLLTLCNVLCFCCCLLALGIHVSFPAALLVFSFGVGAGIATPTPGGLGGFEAGLAGGLAAYHVDSGAALAAALLYRLVSYWLPLLPGAAALIVCQRRQWLNLERTQRGGILT